MTIFEGIIIIIALVAGFFLRDFSLNKITKKLNPIKDIKETPKVSVLYPTNTKEEEKREKAKELENTLKKAGIKKI